MDPLTISALIGGASSVLGRVLPSGQSMPGGPAISSAYGGAITAPFNVGGGLGGAGQLGTLTTGLGAIVPWLIGGFVLWQLLKK